PRSVEEPLKRVPDFRVTCEEIRPDGGSTAGEDIGTVLADRIKMLEQNPPKSGVAAVAATPSCHVPGQPADTVLAPLPDQVREDLLCSPDVPSIVQGVQEGAADDVQPRLTLFVQQNRRSTRDRGFLVAEAPAEETWPALIPHESDARCEGVRQSLVL